jgi:hypothetical protein
MAISRRGDKYTVKVWIFLVAEHILRVPIAQPQGTGAQDAPVGSNRIQHDQPRLGSQAGGSDSSKCGLAAVVPRKPSVSFDARDKLEIHHGRSVKASVWPGRTTLKWRRSTVATSVMSRRSAAATTEASTVPSGRSL